jgi:Arylsulfotransferase (ASST)
MRQDRILERDWSRRRFLKAGGVMVVGAGALGALVVEACTSASPSGGSPGSSPGGSPPPVARRRYRSRPDLTAPPVDVASPVGSVAPGLVFITPNNGKAPDGLLMTDNAGKPVWIRPDTGSYAANFRPAVYGGKPVLTWWEGATNGGYGSGQLVIVDDTYTELVRIGAGQGRKADIHEFQITPQQTALLLTDQGVPIPAGATPPPYQNWDCIAVELDIQTGAVLFEWHSADHIDPSESVLPAPGTAGSPIPTGTPFAAPTPGGSATTPAVPVYDSVHANAIELDTDGHLLVSARNTSTIYKVDRSTGNILWRLGGKKSDFKMGDGASFGLQHDPRRHADGTLSIFDDGTAGPSRGIVLNVDEVAMTASLVREYPHPHGKFAMSQGNMEILPNGNVFVGWGSTGYASEFSTDGQLQFDADFSGSVQSYRCFRYPWVAQPSTQPAVAVDPPSNGTVTVYASWNGATEVVTWEVMSGADPSQLASLGTFPRTDFETVLAVKPGGTLLAVRALDASGMVLGTSAAVTLQG